MTDKEFADVVGSTKKIVLSAIERNLSGRFYHAIDDIVQETYIRAYKSIIKNKFRGDSGIGTWLYAIARNEALRMNNKLAREEQKFKKTMSLASQTGEERNHDQGDIDYLFYAIDTLPDIYRNVMKHVAGGLSVKQIAEKLDIEPGTVKSRTSRGKEMLKKILEAGHE